MNTDPEQRRAAARLQLRGDLNIYSAATIKDSLLGGLNRVPQLEVDLSEVGSVDGAGLQVLALAARESRRSGKTLRLVGRCESFARLIELFRMNQHFGDALAEPAPSPAVGRS